MNAALQQRKMVTNVGKSDIALRTAFLPTTGKQMHMEREKQQTREGASILHQTCVVPL